jgi:hypothetical protein
MKEKKEEVKNVFYETFELVYDTHPRHNVKVVIGNLNAKLGKEEGYRPTVIGRESLHSISYDNGTRLVNFSASRDIVISSTYSPINDIYKQTKHGYHLMEAPLIRSTTQRSIKNSDHG